MPNRPLLPGTGFQIGNLRHYHFYLTELDMKGKLVTRTVEKLFVIKCPEDGKIGWEREAWINLMLAPQRDFN